jgi:hypothetical protein
MLVWFVLLKYLFYAYLLAKYEEKPTQEQFEPIECCPVSEMERETKETLQFPTNIS